MAEYALMAALIAAVAMVGVNSLGVQLGNLWQYCSETAVNAIGG